VGLSAVAQIAALDRAFASQQCDKVMELASGLGISPPWRDTTTLPPTTAAAVAVCRSILAPGDLTKAKFASRVLEDLNEAQLPLLSAPWIERLRSDRLAATGNISDAMQAKQDEMQILRSYELRRRALELELRELSEPSPLFTADQRQALEKVILASQNDSSLLRTLQDIDTILTQVHAPKAREAIIEQRAHLVARLEELFARDFARVEELKGQSKSSEARSLAHELKRKYPLSSFGIRLDAAVGESQWTPNLDTDPLRTPPAFGSTPAPIGDTALADKALADAKAAINSGDPAAAVNILDSISDSERNEKTRRLRKEAADLHVKDLRTKVREIYERAKGQTNRETKLEALRKCKELLELVLSRYPESTARKGVEMNLRTINLDIEELAKGK
jgi:hypothetical protein